MKMKKIISWGMMLAAAFTLTNCAKEIDAPVQEPESAGIPFEIVASTVDTKTVNDGMHTKWAAKDQINLFHAVCDSDDYKNNGVFEVKETESGNFAGNLCEKLDPQEEYDWYAFYPYKSQIVSPKNEAGWAYIGNKNGITQEGGYGKTAHLASSNCPLYGVKKAVPAADTPSIEMQHLSSVVAINVTNMTDEPLTVTSATLTANEPIVGSFYIDFSESPTYTASEGQYVSNAATVNVKGGTALGNGDSGVLYLVVKPFTAAKDSKLCLSVNGYEKELTMPQDVTFTAGKIKTLNFAYDKPEAPEVEGTATATLTFDASKVNRLSYSTTEQVWFQNGITFTNTKESSTSNIGDYGNPVRLYKSSKFTIKAPGNITKIVFNSAANESDDAKKYLDFLKTAVGSNVVDGTKVTVELEGTISSVTYTTPGQIRLYDITVTYLGEAYVPPTLESLEISDYQTVFTQGDTFAFGGTVSAKYDDGSTRDVTDLSGFSGYDMNTVGKQTVTVSYEDKSVTYDIEVKAPVVTDKKQYTFTITRDDFNTTSYAANNNEKTSTATASDGSTMDVKWTSYQVMNQSSTMQWQKSKGYIYNSTNLGTIDNVEITSSAGTFTTYKGTSAQPTSNGDGGYFQIKVGGATGKVTSIKVTFTK